MALAETQQLRMLARLRSAGQQPVTLDQLRAGGIDFPAVVIGELELNGYVIERVYEHGRQIGVRLLETEALIHRPHVGAPDGAEFRGSHRRRETSAALSVGAGARRNIMTHVDSQVAKRLSPSRSITGITIEVGVEVGPVLAALACRRMSGCLAH